MSTYRLGILIIYLHSDPARVRLTRSLLFSKRHSFSSSLWVQVKDWHDQAAFPPWPHLLLNASTPVLWTHWPPALALNTPATFSAQGLNTSCSFCLEHVTQIPAWLSPILPSDLCSNIFSVRSAGNILISNCNPLQAFPIPLPFFFSIAHTCIYLSIIYRSVLFIVHITPLEGQLYGNRIVFLLFLLYS